MPRAYPRLRLDEDKGLPDSITRLTSTNCTYLWERVRGTSIPQTYRHAGKAKIWESIGKTKEHFLIPPLLA